MRLRTWSLSLLLAIGACLPAMAQPYISTCETVPFACPTLCAGNTLLLRIFQVLRLPVGSEVQAELSDANGNFGAGSQFLPIDAYHVNVGSTFTPGPYIWTRDVAELYAKFTIPANTPAGTLYNLRIRSSSGFASPDNFHCPGNNHIIVTSPSPALPPIAHDSQGQNKWIGHIYTWNPTTSDPLVTPVLIAAQNFFDPANYQGYALYDSLQLNLSFSTTGRRAGLILQRQLVYLCRRGIANQFLYPL